MWKSGFRPRAAATFFPQPHVKVSTAIHSQLWRKFRAQLFHRQKFHIPQGLWKSVESGVWSYGIAFGDDSNNLRSRYHNFTLHSSLFTLNYKQELMLAVTSRTLFCTLLSPFFRATSTFRMAYNTVE